MALTKTRGGYNWATIGRTESGDDLQVVMWDHHPEAEEIDRYYRDNGYDEEYESVGFINWQVEKVVYAP